MLVFGTGDGYVVALDPDKNGSLVWKTKVTNGKNDIRWGGASDGANAYYGLGDQPGGMVAIRLATGERIWVANFNNNREVSNRAAATAIPGVVFIGGTDGKLHALTTEDGHQIWEYDTAREYSTVNKIPGHGGSMAAPGP